MLHPWHGVEIGKNMPDVITAIIEVPKVIEKNMYTVGNKITTNKVTDKLAVRPVVYLQERILFYSVNGTLENPYIIK